MKSNIAGKNTSAVEVTQIDTQGIWILINDKESFLSFGNFPWFKNATVSQIHNVQLLNERYLRWPDLDVDLALESIEHPERFPLVVK